MASKAKKKTESHRSAAPGSRRELEGRLLDARRDRLDLRDRLYTPPLASLPPVYPSPEAIAKFLPAYVKDGLILDQGEDGACTGFGLACVVNYMLWLRHRDSGAKTKFESVSTRMLYHLARFYDEWPGEDYEGSSCRGALKGWHKHGVCSESLWPYRDPKTGKQEFVAPSGKWSQDALTRTLGVYYKINPQSVVDMQAAINENRAIYVSGDVHDGWSTKAVTPRRKEFTLDNLPLIRFDAKKTKADGGHAFAIVGYTPDGFIIQNSWGPGWGLSGFAVLTYADWNKFGSDAWACALGVPKRAGGSAESEPASAPRVFVPSRADAALARLGVDTKAPADGPRLPAGEVFLRTLVLGNDGAVEQRIVEHANSDDTVRKLGNDIPAEWLARRGSREDGRERLVIYAHGGLNSEDASIARIRALGHVFQANGIYPLFITWQTGVRDSIANIIEDHVRDFAAPAGGIGDVFRRLVEHASDAKDRGIEVAARAVLVRALWDQMKQNAAAAASLGRGGRKLAAALEELAAARGNKLEIHLVGHSAGAILLGHLLQHLPRNLASCTLYAPACTVAFANAHYRPAVETGHLPARGFRIHLLSDAREQDDSVGPYGKSLLYLVSRALEPVHKTPILGLERAFDPRHNGTPSWNDENVLVEGADGKTQTLKDQFTAELKTWQKFWGALPGPLDQRLIVENRPGVSMGSTAGMTDATHGCFDNHAEVIDATVAKILGHAPRYHAENLDY